MLSFLSAQGCPRCTLREGHLVSSASPRIIQPPLFSLSYRLPIYCSGHIALADFMTVFCGSIALVVRSLVRQYCRYAGNPTFKQPSTLFRGHRPKVGRTRDTPRGRHTRALVKALADSLLGFWPRCPLSVWSVAGAPGWAREHLVGLCTEHLVGFWSACPECVSGLCFKILDRGRHVPAPSGRDVGSNARAPTRETVQGTDPRNGFLLCRYPHGVLRRSLRRVVRCQPAHGGYDVLGGTSPCSRCPSLVWRHCLRGG